MDKLGADVVSAELFDQSVERIGSVVSVTDTPLEFRFCRSGSQNSSGNSARVSCMSAAVRMLMKEDDFKTIMKEFQAKQ